MANRIKQPDVFINLLQKRWANLFFSRVTKVITKGESLVTQYHILFKDGSFSPNPIHDHEFKRFREGTNKCWTGALNHEVKHTMDEIDEVWEEPSYTEFYGFCQTGPIPNDDIPFRNILSIRPSTLQTSLRNKQGRLQAESVFFHQKQYSALDFELNRSSWFGYWGNTTRQYNPPKVGDLICGIVIRNEKGLSFDRWFICSPEFYQLWKLVMFGHFQLPIEDTKKFRKQFKGPKNYKLVLDRQYRQKDQQGFKYSREEILESYDPNTRRFAGWDSYSGWKDILDIYLKCQNFKPFNRNLLPSLTAADKGLIMKAYKYEPNLYHDYYATMKKREDEMDFSEDIIEDDSWDVRWHGEPLAVNTMKRLRIDEKYKFANFLGKINQKYIHQKRIQQIINY